MKLVHTSVMTKEVLHFLAPKGGNSLLIDCTLGEGGHAEAFLQTFPDLRIVGIDADPTILKIAQERLSPFGDRFLGIESWFDEFFSRYTLKERPDRIFFDLGVSTYHFERSGRGFSFQKDEPLDMRLGKTEGLTAMDLVNTLPIEELADIFYSKGEERYSRRIARAIGKFRGIAPICTSKQLAEIIWKSVPSHYRYGRIHPATRSFQALRIVANRELERLEKTLEGAFSILNSGGRLGIITFHSLEDRIVKQYFRGKSKCSTKDLPIPIMESQPKGFLLTKKPLRPSDEELALNPPSRSAKFRVIEKNERVG